MSSAVFPSLAGLQWGITKRPLWNTRIQKSVSLMETRISFTSLPVWRWSLSYEFLRQNASNAEFQSLSNFFNARQGMWDSWLYSDPSDNAIASGDRSTLGAIGIGDNSDVTFQLGRRLVSGGLLEPIYNVNAAPAIYKDNTLQVVTTDYTLGASGLITFVNPPGVGTVVSWYGTYYWRCRFEQDGVDFREFLNALWSVGELAFVSIKGS